MKLIKLKIGEQFRSLKENFELIFRDSEINESLSNFHPFCFAGLNGSGKSNVLEALSNIFYHLECIINDYPLFAYSPEESKPDVFELEYFIASDTESKEIDSLNHIIIKKEKNTLPQISINGDNFIEISKSFGSSYMPDLVVAYSSGENETISLPYVKMKLFQYDQYIKDLARGDIEFQKPKSSLLYIDYEMSQAVLLTILLFFDFYDQGEKSVLSILDEEMKVSGIEQFSINIHNHWQKLIGDYDEDELIEIETVINLSEGEREKNSKSYIGRIVDNLHSSIYSLKECATSCYEKGDYFSLDFLVDKTTIQLIRKKFDNDAYKFFSVFQILHALNERVEENQYKEEVYNSKGFYTDYKRPEYSHFFYFTNYKIKKKDREKTESLLLRELSDGEQQFLHTLGICLMLQKKRTLLLLDEPETHFNPEWRSKFIDTLRKTLQAGNDNFLLKDIVLTSHSPFIISDCFPDKVIVFTKGEQPKSPDFNTFGTSIGVITSKIFNSNQTIGNYSNDEIQKFEKFFEEKNYNEALQILNAKIGDSVEKLLFINRMKNKYKP